MYMAFFKRFGASAALFLLLSAGLCALFPALQCDATAPERIVIDYTGQSTGRSDAGEVNETEVLIEDVSTGESFSMPLEEYLVGVVAGEMPASFHEEARRAQAVAARSYARYTLQYTPKKHTSGAPLCTDPGCCKAYLSRADAEARYGAEQAALMYQKASEAVSDTAGQILTYQELPVCAVFHSASDGRTDSAENVWGNAVPYLISVSTPELTEESSVSYTQTELLGLLRRGGYAPDENGAFDLTRSSTGRVGAVTLYGVTLSGTEARVLLRLRSSDFTLSVIGDTVTFVCAGYGHGVGMSQYGADALAQEGWDYRQILLHYYPGCVITDGDA